MYAPPCFWSNLLKNISPIVHICAAPAGRRTAGPTRGGEWRGRSTELGGWGVTAWWRLWLAQKEEPGRARPLQPLFKRKGSFQEAGQTGSWVFAKCRQLQRQFLYLHVLRAVLPWSLWGYHPWRGESFTCRPFWAFRQKSVIVSGPTWVHKNGRPCSNSWRCFVAIRLAVTAVAP